MRISKLEPSQRIKERWLVWLEDGSLLRITEREVVSFGLYAGMELSGELFDELSQQALESKLRGKALDLIARRALSRKELQDKLTRSRGPEKPPLATPEQAQEVCDWLEELGYLNDEEYARQVVRHYSAKGYGERRLRDELYLRGVPRLYWEEALTEAADPEDGVDAFLERKFRGRAPDEKDLKRASDALARRGYRWDAIRAGLERYAAGLEWEE